MTAVFVTASELSTTLGIGSLYSPETVEEVCQAAQDLVNGQLWYNSYPVVGAGIYANSGYVVLSGVGTFNAGQTISLVGVGTAYDGLRTITATYPYSTGTPAAFPWFIFYPFNYYAFPKQYSILQFSLTHADDVYHQIEPYGKAQKDYDTQFAIYGSTAAIRLAALEIAVDIWQSKQQSNAGGTSPDFSPSPYRMGYSLLRRTNGLLAPYISPRSMVG